MTPKEAFRLVYSRVRRLRREGASPRVKNVAYLLTGMAIDELIYEDHDYRPLVKVSRAALFATHWRFMKPAADLPKLWASEAHVGFVSGRSESRSWYETPGEWIAISEARAGL